MDTETKTQTADPAVKQTSFVVAPQTAPAQRVVMTAAEDIPAEIKARAAADWMAHKSGADLVSLLNLFNAQHESPQERYDYCLAIARLRYPTPSRAQKAATWRRNAPRTMRKAAA